jgi:hypothetical protein
VAQLGQRTCFGIIPELALCYPASSQLMRDRKWSNKVRSNVCVEATQIRPSQFSIVSAFKPLQRSITALYQQQRNTTSYPPSITTMTALKVTTPPLLTHQLSFH